MTLELRHTPQQARSNATLTALTDAARVAAETFGYDRFTTADVAQISGRSIGTVYRYFPDRLALLDAIDPGRQVAADVRAERARQDQKWGKQAHPDGTGADTRPLLTHVEEPMIRLDDPAARLAASFTARTDHRFSGWRSMDTPPGTWRDILLEEVFEAIAESEPAKIRVELVQIAAVAQQWAEEIDRRAV